MAKLKLVLIASLNTFAMGQQKVSNQLLRSAWHNSIPANQEKKSKRTHCDIKKTGFGIFQNMQGRCTKSAVNEVPNKWCSL